MKAKCCVGVWRGTSTVHERIHEGRPLFGGKRPKKPASHACIQDCPSQVNKMRNLSVTFMPENGVQPACKAVLELDAK